MHTQQDDMIRCVAGTLAIEGITLSNASRSNLDKYANRHATYQQLIDDIKEKISKENDDGYLF